MLRRIPGWYWTILLSLFALGIGLLAPTWFLNNANDVPEQIIAQEPSATASETLPPRTPLASRTPTRTLLPPPSFEPPTATAQATNTANPTATRPITINVTVEGIIGLPSPSATADASCQIRADWTLQYEVQTNETLTMIANTFGISVWELAEGNCIADPNVIRSGQMLYVPGSSLPVAPEVVCEPFELLQPIDGLWDVPATGNITFNWHGPRAPRNVIRIYPPDFDFAEYDRDKFIEYTFDLRQNQSVDLMLLEEGGRWTWQVFPLDRNFVQVCPESPLWSFNKLPLYPDED
jgi:LysM repeat protein